MENIENRPKLNTFLYNRSMKKERLVLVDGNALFHRAYHAVPHLTNKDGDPTNAVYGFANIMIKMMNDLKPKYVVVCWDKSSKTFRKEMYPQYKATRKSMDDELKVQVPFVKELVGALNLPFVELENYEADDIIGTFVEQSKDYETIVVTGDKDELQLIDEHTKIYMLRKGFSETHIYGLEEMIETYGLTPAEFIDLKALQGDSSDNIPGVPGVGPKTAVDLIQKYGSLDGVYQNLDDLKGKLKERLEENKELAYLSYELSKIVRDAPIKLDLHHATLNQVDRQALHELFMRLNFKSLLAKLPPEMAGPEPGKNGDPSLFDDGGVQGGVRERAHLKNVKYSSVTSQTELDILVKKLSGKDVIALDTETTSVDTMVAELVGISLSAKEGEAYYIPVGHKTGNQLKLKDVLETVRPLLEDPKVGKVGHNIKYDYQVLKRAGIHLQGIVFDTMVAAFLVNPIGRTQSLGDLAYGELGIEMIPIEELIGTKGKDQKSFDETDIEVATQYACEDADIAWRLYEELAPRLKKEGFDEIAKKTEWPLIPVLGDMELAGIELDVDFLTKFNKTLSKDILACQEKIWKIAGSTFNISSPNQLQDVLFNKLGLPTQGVKKGKTGYSTAANELDRLRGTHEIIDHISQYRELTKLKSTYVDALPGQVSEVDGRVHTSFNQTIAQTGRLSSINPNLQNIPVRTPIGREIRKAFVAPKGRVLVSADYSQIELRVAAALSKDEGMIETFTKGIDLHQQTAAELFGVKLEDVTKEQRYAAKTINFGVLYGMSAHGLTVATGMTHEESIAFIARYFEVRPKLKQYIEDTKAFAREHEYTTTLLGRKRPCPEINSNNHIISAAAERMAVNVPIQGTAADIYKLAMIAVAPKLDDDTHLLLQIHDELIVETDKDKADTVAKILKDTMEAAYDLGVPLAVDTDSGKNWGEL